MQAAEVFELTADNWARARLKGREVDAAVGDWVLVSDRLVAVVADTRPDRDANHEARAVGGALIDLLRPEEVDDQLTLWDPRPRALRLSETEITAAEGRAVELVCRSSPSEGGARLTVRYQLADGDDFVRIECHVEAPSGAPVSFQSADGVVAGGFEAHTGAEGRIAWVENRWFPAAYGVVPEDGNTVRGRLSRLPHRPGPFLYYRGESGAVRIDPGGQFTWARKIYCARDSLGLRTMASAAAMPGVPTRRVQVALRGPSGPVVDAHCTVTVGPERFGSGITGADGTLDFELGPGAATLRVNAYGRPKKAVDLAGTGALDLDVSLAEPAWIAGAFTDEEGRPLPCTIQIVGREGTPSPDFFPATGEFRVHGAIYTVNGRFRQALRPGSYTAIASRGPEYDVARVDFKARRGGTTRITGRLIRSVDTRGWIATDLHGHTSTSGDTHASAFGRVLSLACAGIEFAPRTEHDRIDSFDGLLASSGLRRWLASSPGVELSGDSTRVGHHLAFPMPLAPHEQGGGCPPRNTDPVEQARQLAEWGDPNERFVVLCHASLSAALYDRDQDGVYDGGHPGLLEAIDAIELQPLARIFQPVATGAKETNRIGAWMQALNQGLRKPGVATNDLHTNVRGVARTYVQSSTDLPAGIRPRAVVRHLEAGHAIMTTGPFLEMTVEARRSDRRDPRTALPGDELVLEPGEKTFVKLRVQCANWYDVDRVQVLVNGLRDPRFDFRRSDVPELFRAGALRFEHEVEIELVTDAHLIAACIDTEGDLDSVLPAINTRRERVQAVAVTNPVFIDIDADGFTPNKDELGSPLPLPE